MGPIERASGGEPENSVVMGHHRSGNFMLRIAMKLLWGPLTEGIK